MRLLLFFLITSITIFFSCNTTEPEMKAQYPPGYQHDIPWPSLADSPWPMNNHDPQRTGRSKYPGPQLGILEKVVFTDELQSGIIAGIDSVLYCTSSKTMDGGVYAFSHDGAMKWRNRIRFSYAAPIALSDSTILVLNTSSVNCIKPDGKIKWSFEDKDLISYWSSVLAVDKEGNIYYTTLKKLNVLNSEGTLKWSLTDESINYVPANNITFSPDGMSLYMGGRGFSLVAVDILTKSVKWKIEGTGELFPPLADSYGNIYYLQTITLNNYIISINPSGEIRWRIKAEAKSYSDLTMDKNGNLFAGDISGNIYCIDYNGELKWKRKLPDSCNIAGGLLCDVNGIVYVMGLSLKTYTANYYAFNNDGSVKWKCDMKDKENAGVVSSSPAIINNRLIVPTADSHDFFIIK